jgi:hypothetical protein
MWLLNHFRDLSRAALLEEGGFQGRICPAGRQVIKRAAAPALAAFLVVSGCATVSSPWYEQLKSYPLLRLGDPKPADGKYVVHLPAGEAIPTRIIIEGSMFYEREAQEVYAVPKRDIYFYEDYISFDMKTWTRTREALDLYWDVTVPGHGKPEPGTILIKVDRKE